MYQQTVAASRRCLTAYLISYTVNTCRINLHTKSALQLTCNNFINIPSVLEWSYFLVHHLPATISVSVAILSGSIIIVVRLYLLLCLFFVEFFVTWLYSKYTDPIIQSWFNVCVNQNEQRLLMIILHLTCWNAFSQFCSWNTVNKLDININLLMVLKYQ